MMMSTQTEFLNTLQGMIRQELARTPASRMVETARVHSVSGGQAFIIFDGEDAPSQKIHPAFTSYTPAVGDRVMLIQGIIIGGWRP